MQFGAMNHPLLPILDEINLFADFGFDYLELTMDAPKAHYTTVQAQKKDILYTLDRRGLLAWLLDRDRRRGFVISHHGTGGPVGRDIGQ